MDGNPSTIPYVQARDQWPGLTPVGLTIHDMEAPEKGDTAERIAQYFRNPQRTSSAHYCLDIDSIVQCVRDHNRAAHAKGVNSKHLGLEHAGYAGQTAAEWTDAYSWAMLQRSAKFAAAKCDQYGIPKLYLPVSELKKGNFRGITTHNNVSRAIPGSGHWDPGPNFPMGRYIELVQRGAGAVKPPPAKGFKLGDRGAGVGFLQAMLNILAKQRIPASGKGHGGQLDIDKKMPHYGPRTREAVAEFERFCNVMLKMAGKPTVKVDGIADSQVCGYIAFWVHQLNIKA